MDTQKSNDLSDLLTASRKELLVLYEREYGQALGPRTSIEYLRQNLAWNQQARDRNQDPRKLRQRLIRELEQALGERTKRGVVPYRPGTRIVREWHGQTYEVIVLDSGYAWRGETYASLTKIATLITGSKRSGPKFFGLKGGDREGT